MGSISTPLTKLFGIKHPIFLAGMNVAAGPGLAAAVTNAGGLGMSTLHTRDPMLMVCRRHRRCRIVLSLIFARY
jgi:NAD(P)H-dependent flavin oxidoreductase YrpB (nitropropane dioxygenase family)